MYRIDWANDSPTAAATRALLTISRQDSTAVNNSNYGWVAGGNTFPTLSTAVERIDFSNDSSTPVIRGPLSNPGRASMGATGNANYGWFGGGSGPVSIINRIDYSNDSPTAASPRGLLTIGRNSSAATGNANYGWWGGGQTPGGDASTIDRIDFSNDSPTGATARGLLSITRQNFSAVSNYVKPLIVPRSATSINPSAGTVAVGNASYGWVGGGNMPATPNSSVDRIDFANDTVTALARGPLSFARRDHAATSNANYGWFGGGLYYPNPTTLQYTTVDRIDFSNDSPTAAIARGQLNAARYLMGSTGNANYGWFGGGYTGAGGARSIVDRVDYSNDATTARPRGLLSVARYRIAATGNNNYGWYAGGTSPGPSYSTVDRIDYANDSPTAASPRGTGQTGSHDSATGNANYGWFHSTFTSSLYRIDYSNDSPTSTSPRGPLTSTKAYLSATGNANYGWFAGGYAPVAITFSAVDRIDFSNDSPTAASPRGLLTAGRYSHASVSNYVKSSFPITLGDGENYGSLFGGLSYGWIGGGGLFGGNISQADRIDFSNDSPASASRRGAFSSSKATPAAVGNTNYGWWGLASLTPSTGESTVERLDFSNDLVTASVRGLLSLTRFTASAVATNNYGWWGGGKDASPRSTVDRVDFSNDSPASASPRGPLSASRYGLASAGNANYGWFGGGSAGGGAQNIVDRVDFSNDSPVSASPRSPLTTSGVLKMAMSNANYGWFSGGYNSGFYSRVDRINFANDTVTPSVRGNLTASKYTSAASGNANYGWIAGGTITGIVLISTVERIDYSNDSPTSASGRGPLSAIRGNLGGTSNYVKTSSVRIVSSGTTVALNINLGIPQYAKTVNPVGTGGTYGWFGGGYLSFPTIVSTVDRVDFSNDSPTAASRRGPLALARNNLAATSNASYGWFIGGGLARYSVVERIDYSNDSPTTASPRGSLTGPRYALVATGNANYGWVTGGIDNNSPSNFYTTVERIDYANDSSTTGVRGSLKFSKYVGAATGNANYGWFAGGSIPPSPYASSLVERIDYSNDSPTGASTRGLLSFERFSHAATSNANYGWFAGGSGAATALTSIDRIDFANDSPASSSPRGPLSASRFGLSGSGNANYGWFGGGSGGYLGPPSPTVYNIVERIDYSNDSPTSASPRGPLSAARYSLGGSSNYVK
jgi:hypothetical protein